jgi:hypothetical protein
MKRIPPKVLVFCLVASTAHSTQVRPKKLSELVAGADHVVIGKVVKVDMIDMDGKQVKSRKGRTGPGLLNQLRLHIKIPKDGVLRTTGEKPVNLVIPLWSAWHYTLGQWQDLAEGKKFIFLLKGEDYQRVYPGLFIRPITEKAKIEKMLRNKRTKNKPDSSDGK